jgi:hypothetical protein
MGEVVLGFCAMLASVPVVAQAADDDGSGERRSRRWSGLYSFPSPLWDGPVPKKSKQ